MAKKGDSAAVSDAIRPADYRGAAQLIRTIQPKKLNIAKINGEIGEIWAKVIGKKVNKDAGKFFMTLEKMEDAERQTVVRDLNKLIDAAGWDFQAADLVDIAEGKQPVVGRPKLAAVPDVDDGDGEAGDDAGESDTIEGGNGKPLKVSKGAKSFTDSLASARARNGDGSKRENTIQ